MTASRSLDIDRLLRDTAAILRTSEWGQGNGTVCLMVAFGDVAFLGTHPYSAHTYDDALRNMGFATFDQAVAWNDKPGRTAKEVIARVEGAIQADVTRA